MKFVGMWTVPSLNILKVDGTVTNASHFTVQFAIIIWASHFSLYQHSSLKFIINFTVHFAEIISSNWDPCNNIIISSRGSKYFTRGPYNKLSEKLVLRGSIFFKPILKN